MFEAHLSDPCHGEVTKTGNTKEEAVEAAFRGLAERWMYESDLRNLSSEPLFDGEIYDNGEVWLFDRMPMLVGTVRAI